MTCWRRLRDWQRAGIWKRPAVCYERRADIFQAFHHLAAALTCLRFADRCYH
jgi:DNA-binding Lrp family transcriptional regulator